MTLPDLTFDHVLVPSETRPVPGIGHGLFATADIEQGAVVAVFGGMVTHYETFKLLPPERQQRSFQIGEELYMVSGERPDLADFINHSCDPTAILIGDTTLAARRSIRAGEEITYDYATSDSSPYDEFECLCRKDGCRRKVTGEDWLRPSIQERYAGQFAPYLQRRIDSMNL